MQNNTDFEIISILKQTKSIVSGTHLSHHLKLSRTAIWKRIKLLRDVGYVITSHADGYQFLSAPLSPIGEEIRWFLDPLDPPHVQVFKEIDSTNRFLMNLGRHGTQQNQIVAAEFQSAGRGRFNRQWISERGAGVYFSMLLNSSKHLPESDHLLRLTPLATISVIETLNRMVPCLKCSIKWPNDIYVESKKMVGILTEAEMEEGRLRFAVVGIGLNLFPSKTHPETATALSHFTNIPFNQNQFIASVYDTFTSSLTNLTQKKWDSKFQKWKQISMLLGKRVSIHTGKSEVIGVVDGFESNCSIRLKDDAGHFQILSAGDASLKV